MDECTHHMTSVVIIELYELCQLGSQCDLNNDWFYQPQLNELHVITIVPAWALSQLNSGSYAWIPHT